MFTVHFRSLHLMFRPPFQCRSCLRQTSVSFVCSQICKTVNTAVIAVGVVEFVGCLTTASLLSRWIDTNWGMRSTLSWLRHRIHVAFFFYSGCSLDGQQFLLSPYNSAKAQIQMSSAWISHLWVAHYVYRVCKADFFEGGDAKVALCQHRTFLWLPQHQSRDHDRS